VPSQSVAAADPRGRGSQALADESNASKSSWLRRSRSRISRRSGEGRNRTGDTTVFSRVLYQLSYPASRIAPTALAITGETRFPPWAPRQGPQEQRGRPSRPLESETRATRAEAISGEGRNRTGDTTVFSRVLYQLSYLASRIAPTALAITGETRFPPWAPSSRSTRATRPAKPASRGRNPCNPHRGDSGEGRNRTGDTTVFSRVLYRLSYLAEETECSGAPDQPPQSQSRTRAAPEPGYARREAKRVRGRTTK
jgi:hypothetical protein